jgi:hypothetical protein
MSLIFESAMSMSDLFLYVSRHAEDCASYFGIDEKGAWLSVGEFDIERLSDKEMRQIILRLYDREDKGQKLHMRRILKAMKEMVDGV